MRASTAGSRLQVFALMMSLSIPRSGLWLLWNVFEGQESNQYDARSLGAQLEQRDLSSCLLPFRVHPCNRPLCCLEFS